MDKLELRDIHLPTVIGWWPPAIGWWLAALAAIAVAAGGYWLFRRWRRDTALKSGRRLLQQIRQASGDDPLACAAALSALLRRVAISGDSRQQVASLHGREWLNYLDRGLNDTPFATGVGRILADAHYRPTPPADLDLDALFALCERWLKQQESRKC